MDKWLMQAIGVTSVAFTAFILAVVRGDLLFAAVFGLAVGLGVQAIIRGKIGRSATASPASRRMLTFGRAASWLVLPSWVAKGKQTIASLFALNAAGVIPRKSSTHGIVLLLIICCRLIVSPV